MLSHSSLYDIAFEFVKRGIVGFNRNTEKYYITHNDLYIPVSYGFDSVAIVQKKNLLKSRLDANITSEAIRGVFLSEPMMASNMSTVVNADFCILLNKLGAMGVMHRADDEDVVVREVRKISTHCANVAASIGVTEDQFNFCSKLIDNGANIIFIDIAHGYSDYVLEFGRKIKKEFGIKVVVGNTTNIEMLKEASDFADAIKVGIAQGYACETKNTAGCTERQFSAILKFKALSNQYGIPIISDGGIENLLILPRLSQLEQIQLWQVRFLQNVQKAQLRL